MHMSKYFLGSALTTWLYFCILILIIGKATSCLNMITGGESMHKLNKTSGELGLSNVKGFLVLISVKH